MKIPLLFTAFLTTAPVLAQSYEITSFTIDAGGVTTQSTGNLTMSSSIGQPESGQPQFSGSLQIASGFWPGVMTDLICVADFAAPFGTLNFFDVSAFLGAYNSEDPISDLNQDGVFNFFDVSTFLAAYSAGCP